MYFSSYTGQEVLIITYLLYILFLIQHFRLVQHLDDILPYSEVHPTEVAQLLIEIFAGEPAAKKSDIFQIIDNIHLKINEGQIKLLLQVATRKEKKKLPGLPLLNALLFIATVRISQPFVFRLNIAVFHDTA